MVIIKKAKEVISNVGEGIRSLGRSIRRVAPKAITGDKKADQPRFSRKAKTGGTQPKASKATRARREAKKRDANRKRARR